MYINATAKRSPAGSRVAEQRGRRVLPGDSGDFALSPSGRCGPGVPVAYSRRHPDEVISAEIAQNAKSWAVLRRLGVRDGDELPLVFYFETAGSRADRELAGFLRSEAGYKIVIEPDGLTGWTPRSHSAVPRSTTGSEAALRELRARGLRLRRLDGDRARRPEVRRLATG